MQDHHHQPSGRLIVVEGTDGSGKSTAIELLGKWLASQGYPVYRTAWNSSPLIKPFMRQAKKKRWLGPAAFSLLHASDFHDRLNRLILPRLQAGFIVLADRWVYTAWVRDHVRGLDLDWVKTLYEDVPKPDLAIYFSTPPDIAVARLKHATRELKYYESGQDISGLHDPWSSFLWFQEQMRQSYLALTEQGFLQAFDATLPISEQQKILRSWLKPVLEGVPLIGPFLGSSPGEDNSEAH
ncbi:dTMP kinase [Sulfobacillus thermosulfidooxidans]|uniref:dTMP kinase n=1 Tax=Sulfobacillus thermosulfidooxidans TaxID=28034 RepID=UPI000AC38B8A|nr:dTMP kinase [Sulfobacillus thermosulfidooxidans]